METNKQKSKRLRKEFNTACRERDGNQCVFCVDTPLDDVRVIHRDSPAKPSTIAVHHITDRHEMPNGGYAEENGMCLCDAHHELAELFHVSNGEKWMEGMHPDDLYKLIGSSKEIALKACENLK